MAKEPTKFSRVINEKSNALYTVTLQDENIEAIGSAEIDSLTLTLSNVADGAIINSRDAVNALNANSVTVSADGELVYTLLAADTTMVDPTREFETHRATFQMNFNTVGFATWDVDMTIRNLTQVS